MATPLRNFLSSTSAAISAGDGEDLALLLMLEKTAMPQVAPAAAELAASGRLKDTVAAFFSPVQEATKGWHAVLSAHLAATAAASTGDWEGAFTANHEALSAFLDILQASSTNWLVRPLHALVKDTVRAIRSHEASLRTRGVREGCPEKVNSLVTTLRNAFNFTLNHRLPKEQLPLSKKWGALAIVNTLFSIFFHADQLRQCKFFIRGVETPLFPPLEQFPKAQLTTYRYYSGVLAAAEDDYRRALTCLSQAYKLCHGGERYKANRRRILEVLIPVSIYASGRLPSAALLARYDGLQALYGPIVQALKTGDIALFNATMESKRESYIQKGVYLTIERLQIFVYRSLFKKICTYLTELTGSVQIKLTHLQAGLEAAGADGVDLDEVECLLANLIFRKMIRGYLSHKPPVLVLAKQGAFKPLPEILAATGPAGAGAAAPDP